MRYNYNYKALNYAGNSVSGQLMAGTEADAISELRTRGLYPTEITLCCETSKETLRESTARKKFVPGKGSFFALGLIVGTIVTYITIVFQ